LTDALRLCLLIPPLRILVKRGLTAWLRRYLRDGTVRFYTSAGSGPARGTLEGDRIIDAHVIETRVNGTGREN
jgi:UPF0716 family protein affecting phage T7 exclusion